jgi:hypothetical protein
MAARRREAARPGTDERMSFDEVPFMDHPSAIRRT